ncbi:hypothetical protein ABZ949_02245 [Micromonospora tulbaghiae]|uniref:hypothetical protein n=1 Tax=Micromonospora tulbaghiae TaxID=479978 RepID=UPI0033D1FCD3
MRRLQHRVGRRGIALLVFAGIDIALAIRLATAANDATDFYAWLWVLTPLAALWAGVAVICLVGALRGTDRVAFAAAIGVKVLWCTLYLCGWVIGQVPDGWVSAAVWGGFAVIVWLIAGWPEPVNGKGRPAWTPPLD